jgi:hypothetical protein
MPDTLTRPRPAQLLACLLALVLLAACDPFDVGHDTVRIEVDTDDGSAVRLITSHQFRVGLNEENVEIFDLITADTAWVTVPYGEDFDLGSSGRFYARAAEAENPAAVVTMRALVDGDETFFQESVLTGEGTQFYYRTY